MLEKRKKLKKKNIKSEFYAIKKKSLELIAATPGFSVV